MPDDEIKAALAQLTARLDAVLTGRVDEHNIFHPGVLPTQHDHARRIAVLEDAQEDAERQRLSWRHAIGLLLAGGGLNAALGYVRDHMK